MEKETAHDFILESYRIRLKHYYEKGIGEKSELSKNTMITPTLVGNCLERYIELGGDSEFTDVEDARYKKFLLAMSSLIDVSV